MESGCLVDAEEVDPPIRQFPHLQQRIRAAQALRKMHLSQAQLFAKSVHAFFEIDTRHGWGHGADVSGHVPQYLVNVSICLPLTRKLQAKRQPVGRLSAVRGKASSAFS